MRHLDASRTKTACRLQNVLQSGVLLVSEHVDGDGANGVCTYTQPCEAVGSAMCRLLSLKTLAQNVIKWRIYGRRADARSGSRVSLWDCKGGTLTLMTHPHYLLGRAPMQSTDFHLAQVRVA